jgi:hypothetical protein
MTKLLLTRRLQSPSRAGDAATPTAADPRPESVLRAPSWLFSEYAGHRRPPPEHPGPTLVAHLVGMEDKMAAMRLAGWWRREADVLLGVIPLAMGASAGDSNGGTDASQQGARERRAIESLHRRPALMLSESGWATDTATLAEHASLLDTSTALSILVDATAVWPAVGRTATCALCVSSNAHFRERLAHDVVSCNGSSSRAPRAHDLNPKLGLLQCRHWGIEYHQKLSSGSRSSEQRCCEGVGHEQDMTCQLLPSLKHGRKKLHWNPDACYSQGGALFAVDVRRLLRHGALTPRPLSMPRSLWRHHQLDAGRFVSWLHHSVLNTSRDGGEGNQLAPGRGDWGHAVRELLVLSPPAPQHSEEAEPVPAVVGAEHVEGFSGRLALHTHRCGAIRETAATVDDVSTKSGAGELCLRGLNSVVSAPPPPLPLSQGGGRTPSTIHRAGR